jgi:O-antigen/teichoic acid export membrane protein
MSSKKLISNTIIYTTANVLQQGINFALIPIYAKYLTAQQYGIVGLITSFSMTLSILFSLSLESTVIRFYFKNNQDKSYHKQLYGSILMVVLAVSLISFLLIYSIRDFLAPIFLKGIPTDPFVLLGLLYVSTTPVVTIFMHILRAQQKGFTYAFVSFSKFLMQFGLVILVLVALHKGPAEVLGVRVLTNVTFFIIALIFLISRYGLRYDRQQMKGAFKYSLPLIPNKLSGICANSLNILMVNAMKSTSEAGIFNMGMQIGSVPKLLIESLHNAYLPWCYEQLEDFGKKGRERIVRASRVILIGFSLLAFVLAFFITDLFKVITIGEFYKAHKIIPFVAFYSIFNMVKNIWLVPLLYYEKGTKYAPVATYANLGFEVALSLLLIPFFGIIGAAIALLAAKIIASFIMMFFSLKFENVGHNSFYIYGIPTLFFALSFLSYVPILNWFVFKLLISLLIFGSSYLFIRKDLGNVKDIFKRKGKEKKESTPPELVKAAN